MSRRLHSSSNSSYVGNIPYYRDIRPTQPIIYIESLQSSHLTARLIEQSWCGPANGGRPWYALRLD